MKIIGGAFKSKTSETNLAINYEIIKTYIDKYNSLDSLDF